MAAKAGVSACSANTRWCLALIYYFTLCDFMLKALPLSLAIVLRYFPEVVLYILVLWNLKKDRRVASFPLFWPLCLCMVAMMMSGLLNASPLSEVAGDFRSFFRFAAFTYLLWRTTTTRSQIFQFVDGFLRLTVLELIVGGMELIGGEGAQTFFSPAIGWGDGAPTIGDHSNPDGGSWIAGTLSNYNHFGMFMTLSCILALVMYFAKAQRRYLWLAATASLAVVLSFSRHSLLLLLFGTSLLLLLQRRRCAKVLRLRRIFAVAVFACLLVGASGTWSSALKERVASAVSAEVVGGDPYANIRLYMCLELTPRFLSSYPFFGQGPVSQLDSAKVSGQDDSVGFPLKAAPDLPGYVTHYIGDVVWVMILGLYGCVGLSAFGIVFWSIAAAAIRVMKSNDNLHGTMLAQGCLILVVLFLISGFFSEEMIARDTIPIFWAIAGLVFSLSRSRDSHIKPLKAAPSCRSANL